MKQNNIGITILLGLIIVVAIGTIIFINNNNTSPYQEENKSINLPPTNMKKENICIASFTTNLTYPDNNRTHNIITACNNLNNYIIMADQTFSFNHVLGPFNENQGYVESTGFDSNGKVIKIIGGGICQVSSTLYNAALMADLEIIERHAHSAPVDYVPQGKDATVCYSNVDFKFKNTTNKNIIIKSICNGNNVKIELYEEN